MPNGLAGRCYMYLIGPIPPPKREAFEKWARELYKWNDKFPKGVGFAHVYRVSIGSNFFNYYIHFEFKTFSELDDLIKNSGALRKFHQELVQFFGDCTRVENWVLDRLA